MNILIIGSGGREHAIALKLFEENPNNKLYIAPGNGGTAELGMNIAINISDSKEAINFCKANSVELVIIGPEKPLVDGLANDLRNESILVFGPGKLAARIEGDKEFAKILMKESHIPTADFKSFNKNQFNEAIEYLEKSEFPTVIKASGLAAGKGVIICNDFNEARNALDDMMNNSIFGQAGDTVVIEEFLEGEELSVFVVTDGEDYVILPASQDHKKIGEGDTGPNTGGMGAYSPIKFLNEELLLEIENNVIIPSLKGLRDKNAKFNGCLYCGLIKCADGIKVIEFNCRFGDPEIQAVLQLIDGDLLRLLTSTAKGNIDKNCVGYNGKSAMCVVAASGGYPGKYEKGFEITGLPDNSDQIKVIHAGTKLENGKLYTHGGRVLNIVAISSKNNITDCKTIGYSVLDKVKFDNIYFRRDIGFKALQ